jgi:hypothetical protein
MTLILPSTARVSRRNKLREALGGRDERSFRNGVAMTNAVAAAVQRVAQERGLRMPEVLDALICTLVSFIQSQAPNSEWATAGEVIADEVRSRLLVTGDTGDDDYVRKMV